MKLAGTVLKCLRREKSGSVAVEFALLVPTFLFMIFAAFDSILTSIGEYVLIKETNAVVRRLTTEQWTKANTQDINTKFCATLGTLFDCSMASDKRRLFIDVRSYDSLDSIPVYLNPKGANPQDFAGFKFDPGGAGTLNVLRVYYAWETKLEVVRPLLSGASKNGKQQNFTYLMMVTEVYRNPA